MSSQLQALALPGSRGRLGCAKVGEVAGDLATALRRAVPFLSRKRLAVTPELPTCITFADLAGDITIVHVTALAFSQKPEHGGGTTRGLLLVDETALGRILDGVLGGDGTATLGTATLTAAQNALASRVAGSMLRALGDVIAAKLELTVEASTSKEVQAGLAVVVALAIEGGGRVLVAIPLAALPSAEQPAPKEIVNPALAAAMTEVEVEMVAELGKLRLPLDVIANLAVGDVLRLPLPLDERARVCAGGAVLFRGRPTASGDVVGVALETHAG